MVNITTELVLKTNYGQECILFASDLQVTSTDDDGNIEETDMISEKESFQYKIIGGKYTNRRDRTPYCWLLSDAGASVTASKKFILDMLGQNGRTTSRKKPWEIIRRAVDNYNIKDYPKAHFEEVNTLNTIIRRTSKDSDTYTEYLMAVNYPEMKFWYVDQYGNLIDNTEEREFEYDAIGSGSDFAIEYIEKQIEMAKIDPKKIDYHIALKIIDNALLKCGNDPWTGFVYDVGIITKSRVKFFGERTKKKLRDWRTEDFLEIGSDIEKILKEEV